MTQTVLVIGYVWPEPRSSAAGSHMLSLLRLFRQQGWQVVFATPAQKTEHMIDLAEEGIESLAIQLNHSSFDDFVATLNPDYVLFDRFMMEEQFGWRVEKACPDAMRILDTEDLQCLRSARQKILKENASLSDTLLSQHLMNSELAKREIAAILRCDLSLIISDYEISLLKDSFKVDSTLIHHLPFMLDLNQHPIKEKCFSDRKHFVTIGNFRHAPNWDSVLYLQQVWPLIKKQIPEAELHIYGAYPPKKATQLNNPKTGFLVKGWAEDAFEVLGDARVCLAPLRFGAGIKGKLIDAMLMGTPSVTTSIGAEGMAGTDEWPGIIADSTDSIIQAAMTLYQSEEHWQQSTCSLPELLKQRYDKTVLSEQLMDIIKNIKTDLAQHRENNFTGAMLRHHSMKSTYFMSKWIEAKNRPTKTA